MSWLYFPSGDTFIILSRARGWWVVQRDPSGTGVLDTDTSKQGWVPAGCLLETNVPVASAIAEANAARALNGGSPTIPASKTPILPLSILSTSFPGVALMDYRKKGDEELDLVKDDYYECSSDITTGPMYVIYYTFWVSHRWHALYLGRERRGRWSRLGTSKLHHAKLS